VFANVLNEKCGFSLELDDMFDKFVGRSSAQCMELIEEMLGFKPPAGLEARYKNDINAALRKSVVAVNGIEQALENISIPYCVASSGSYEKMRTTLGKTNLLETFEGKLHRTLHVENRFPTYIFMRLKAWGILSLRNAWLLRIVRLELRAVSQLGW